MKLLAEGIIFLTYVLICGGLMKSRCSGKAGLCALGGIAGGVILLQAVFLFLGQDVTLVLTLLPITAYLPFSVGLYFLTGFCIFQTVSVWAMGYFAVFILKVLKKILGWCPVTSMPFPYGELSVVGILVLAAGLLIFLTYRFLRTPFHSCMEKKRPGWQLLFFPVLMSFLLLSYFYNSVSNPTVIVLTFLTALSVFLIIIRVMASQMAMDHMKQAEQDMKEQMQLQLQEYQDVCKRMEAGRIYRHDMRHHLLVLEELAGQSDLEGVRRYIQNMSGQLSDTEREAYCANSTVNAVLSACIGRAREAGCTVTAQISLPEELPLDEMDVCMVLANALENAANACRKIPREQDRYIHIMVEFMDRRRLIISIKNSCDTPVVFDKDGVPVTSGSEEHGIGMKSIRTITDKYNGFFRCKCEEGEFCFQAALFGTQLQEIPLEQEKGSLGKKLVSSLGISAVAVAFFIGCTAVTAQAFAESYGQTVRVQGHSFSAGWGDTSFRADIPVLEETQGPPDVISTETMDKQEAPSEPTDTEVASSEPADTEVASSEPADTEAASPEPADADTEASPPQNDTADLTDGVEEMNHQMEQWREKMRERFIWYASRKYDGYVQSEITWQTLRDDEALLTVRMMDTINAGGSGQYSRCFTLDKNSGNILELSDLFAEGSDYIGVISAEILRQMEAQVQSGAGDYFIPGTIWGEEDWFREIAADQNFYINDRGCLVIVFDEYEVAPGNMGMPEFVLDTGALEGILKQPSVLG